MHDPYSQIAAIAAQRAAQRPQRDRTKQAAPDSVAARHARNARVAASIVASIAFRSTIDARGDYRGTQPAFNGRTKR